MRAVILCLALSACTANLDAVDIPRRTVPQTPTEIAFVTDLFNDIQPLSISDAREYCGLIGLDRDGRFVATEPRRGDTSSCLPPATGWAAMQVIASYHTHGATDLDYFTEVPSFDDMRTDITEKTDGYIATPGGRLWYIDARARIARQICGLGCLVSDPDHLEHSGYSVHHSYTMQELLEF